MSAKIGFYSGTFDPIHDGHVAFAEAVLNDLRLDTIIFLPERSPRGKQNVTDIAVRTQQIAARIATNPSLSVRTLAQPTFTLPDTLNLLRNEYPDTGFTFLFGSDVALNMKNWPHLEILLQNSHIAIGLRGDTSASIIEQYTNALSPAPVYSLHTTDHRHISSSQFR